jgi:hypothetical protein
MKMENGKTNGIQTNNKYQSKNSMQESNSNFQCNNGNGLKSLFKNEYINTNTNSSTPNYTQTMRKVPSSKDKFNRSVNLNKLDNSEINFKKEDISMKGDTSIIDLSKTKSSYIKIKNISKN